jgi:hypothetical protein
LANKTKDELYAFIEAEHQKRIDLKLTQPHAKESQICKFNNVYSARHSVYVSLSGGGVTGVIIELEENDTFTITAKNEKSCGYLELTVRLHKNKQINEKFTFLWKKADFHKDFQLIKGDPQVEQENQHFEQENQEFEQRCRDQDTEQDDQEFEQGDSNK